MNQQLIYLRRTLSHLHERLAASEDARSDDRTRFKERLAEASAELLRQRAVHEAALSTTRADLALVMHSGRPKMSEVSAAQHDMRLSRLF
jgi:hypothetical protein